MRETNIMKIFAYKKRKKVLLMIAAIVLCFISVEIIGIRLVVVQNLKVGFNVISLRTILSTEKRLEPNMCKIVKINPYDTDFMKISRIKKKSIDCSGYLPDLTYINGSRLMINQKHLVLVKNFQSCKYRTIHKSTDIDVKLGNWSKTFSNFVDLPESEEFIVAECHNSTSGLVSKTYHALFPTDKDLVEMDRVKLKKRDVESDPMETLNVIMIGMDGTSRHQLKRGMNKTYRFLIENLDSFDMIMYSQVGSNTFPNLVPLLSGNTAEEVEQWWDRFKYFDPLDTVWKEYANAGYQTLFSEDYPSIGPFHYFKKGFLFPPTTYYSRPICLAMERDTKIRKRGRHCIGNTPEIIFHFNYINTFLETIGDSPYLAMLFLKRLTHNDMTKNIKADLPTYNFYKSLHENNKLNNTLLITFSDHGPRWGEIRESENGIVESRAPYAIFTFPKWFLQKYPDVAEILRTNTKRLTTHFDTHATLRDLLYFKARKKTPLVPSRHGLSLFQEIPKDRTCSDASITLDFCLCGQETMMDLPVTSNISKALAEIVVNAVNTKRNTSLCATLHLKLILQVKTSNIFSFDDHDIRLFRIKLQTLPGDAVYEGTVHTKFCENKHLEYYLDQFRRGDNSSNSLDIKVGNSIDRLNLYKGQADCETKSFQKPYCYCKNLLTT